MNKAYKVITSQGTELKVDQDEIEKITTSMAKGIPCMVRSGIVNPSFIVAVVVDKERMKNWLDECNYTDGSGIEARNNGILPLKSIWEDKSKLLISSKKALDTKQ